MNLYAFDVGRWRYHTSIDFQSCNNRESDISDLDALHSSASRLNLRQSKFHVRNKIILNLTDALCLNPYLSNVCLLCLFCCFRSNFAFRSIFTATLISSAVGLHPAQIFYLLSSAADFDCTRVCLDGNAYVVDDEKNK